MNENRFNQLNKKITGQLEQAIHTGTEAQKQTAIEMLEFIDNLKEICIIQAGQLAGSDLYKKKFQANEDYYNRMIEYKAILTTYGFDPHEEINKYKKSAAAHGAYN